MKKMSRQEILKYEIAEELGLLDKLLQCGWAGLSTQETGRIGGLMRTRNRQNRED